MSATQNRFATILYKGKVSEPVYVAGEFTDPPWQPVEMDPLDPAESHIHNGATFSKEIPVAVGYWQYKFRIGDGDHWECDPEVQIVSDANGFQNNLLTVNESDPVPTREESVKAESKRSHDHSKWYSAGEKQAIPKRPSTSSIALKYGTKTSGVGKSDSGSIKRPLKATRDEEDKLRVSETARESSTGPQEGRHVKDVDRDHPVVVAPTTGLPFIDVTSSNTTAVDDSDEEEFSPLLPHERSIAQVPSTATQTKRARSSSSAYDFKKDRRESIVSPPATKKDMYDASVEAFPHGRDNILERVKTLKNELEPDDCSQLDLSVSAPDHYPRRRSSSLERKSSAHTLGEKMQSPIRSGLHLETIPQEPSALDGADSHSMSSYKTALSQPQALNSHTFRSIQSIPPSYALEQSVSPKVPVRRSSLDKLRVVSKAESDASLDEKAKAVAPSMASPAATEGTEFRGRRPWNGDAAFSTGSTPRSHTGSPAGKGLVRSQTRSISDKSLLRATSSSSRSRSREAGQNNQRWYQKMLAWLSMLFQQLFLKIRKP